MAVFGSKKKSDLEDSAPAEPEEIVRKGYTPAKGAPTPRRKDVEARNRRPLVSNTKSMSKEEKRKYKAEQRARSNELYQKQQHAMRVGDERNMPAQHRGPVRAFGRDYVDATAPISAFFMPLALLLLLLLIVVQPIYPQIIIPIVWAMYLVFLLMLIQGIVVARRAKKLALYSFGEAPSGFVFQMLGRAFYLRRWRLPVPRVARGEYPEGGTREDLKAARAEFRANKKANKKK